MNLHTNLVSNLISCYERNRVRDGDLVGSLEICWPNAVMNNSLSNVKHVFGGVDVSLPKHMTVVANCYAVTKNSIVGSLSCQAPMVTSLTNLSLMYIYC
jgi:hypothetical protein